MQNWFTEEERALMTERARLQPADSDVAPVARLFQPDGRGCWLVSELNPEDEDQAYGLCDLGVGAPELGEFSLSELRRVRGPLGLGVERDRAFRPGLDLDRLARLALEYGRIVA